MRESCTYGVVRGALSNERPYRDHHCFRRSASAPNSAFVFPLPTTISEGMSHWRKMRRSLAGFSGPAQSVHAPSWLDFITIMPVFEFSVHTGAE